MNTQNVITIGRLIGSGGSAIAKEVAEQLGFSFYDKELINLASKESGVAKEYFEQVDERKSFNLFSGYSELTLPYLTEGHYFINNYLNDDVLFDMQSKVIRNLAEEKPCVFVGRCADFVLAENPNCINIFIAANIEDRINRVIAETENLSPEKAKKHIEKMDRRRASYYNYHTNKAWGVASSYDFCVNSSSLSQQECIDLICDFAKKKWAKFN